MRFHRVSRLRKKPFLPAIRRWGRFVQRNVCDSTKEIPYYLKLTSSEVSIILRTRVSKVPSAMVGLRHGIVLSLNDFINVRDTES